MLVGLLVVWFTNQRLRYFITCTTSLVSAVFDCIVLFRRA